MAAKKSDDINKNYPVLGFRVSRVERQEMIRKFDELIELLRNEPEYRRANLKKNAVFLRALEVGIEHITKKKSLG
jgi:hypothetical protein